MDRRRSHNPAAILLADEPSLRLGALMVRPATREVERGGMIETVEPRVMQVLVALARAEGRVVSHEELIERAWGGQVVGEGSIHRVVSHVRRLEAGLGAGCFTLETIVKVGYRLTGAEPARAEPKAEHVPSPPQPKLAGAPAPQKLDRRVLLGCVAAAAATGFGVWRLGRRGEEPGEAEPRDAGAAQGVLAAGQEALRRSLPEEDEQAVAYFRRATELAPRSADAWAGLALAYVQLLDTDIAGEVEANAARAREAARTALALDPGHADARAALILIRPSFRNWRVVEIELRAALGEHPGNIRLQTTLATLLVETGRSRAAIPLLERLIARDARQLTAQIWLAVAYWSAGELLRAEQQWAQAQLLWPRHRHLWLFRLKFLAFTGKTGAALAAINDADARPVAGPREQPLPLHMYAACANALAAPSEASRARAIALVSDMRAKALVGSIDAAMYLAAFNQTGAAFELLERYYFGGGGPDNIRSGPRPLSRRNTAALFVPPMALLRRDPRFGALTQRLGLEDYWRASETQPDYRG